MKAKYFPGLFIERYPILEGEDWIRRVSPEDRAVFVDIGCRAHDHGRQGGRAIVKKRGKEYMRKIGRIGAIAANSIKAWRRAVRDEVERETGVFLDY